MTESSPAEAHAAQMAERAARRRVDRYLDLLRCAHGDLAPLLRDAHTARLEDEKAEDEKADGGAEESSRSSEASNPAPGRERPGIEPDVERTTRLHLPPDIRE